MTVFIISILILSYPNGFQTRETPYFWMFSLMEPASWASGGFSIRMEKEFWFQREKWITSLLMVKVDGSFMTQIRCRSLVERSVWIRIPFIVLANSDLVVSHRSCLEVTSITQLQYILIWFEQGSSIFMIDNTCIQKQCLKTLYQYYISMKSLYQYHNICFVCDWLKIFQKLWKS